MSRFVFIALVPFGIGVWILAARTVGEIIDSAHARGIGFAVAVLTVLEVACILQAPRKPSAAFAIALLVCGFLSLHDAILFQFYLASLAPPLTPRGVELVRFLKISSCLTSLAGIWLLLAGVCIGLVRRDVKPTNPGSHTKARSDHTQPEEYVESM
jgi:hypothetical protein